MEIKSRLRVLNANEVNAVMLQDGNEIYPVFLKSLTNTIIFPELINSGYKLDSLPYGFVKDGTRLSDLPVENYQLSEAEEEAMYNSIGVPVDNDELKKHIDTEAPTGINEPPTNYTIFDRDVFLKYLESVDKTDDDNDFLPINYFVSPSARFSIQEYMHSDYNKYVKIMNKRREMSINKFYKLVEFLKQFGLPGSYTFMDILDAYFAWGMDGLNFKIVNKTRVLSPVKLGVTAYNQSEALYLAHGFMDAAGSLLTPKVPEHLDWKLLDSSPEARNDITSRINGNRLALVQYKAPVKIEISTLEGPGYNIRYNESMLILQRAMFPSISIKSPVDIGRFLDPVLALPNNASSLYEHNLLRAAASAIIKARKCDFEVSSFEALSNCGLNPTAALNFITVTTGLDKANSTANLSEHHPVITYMDIEKYVHGESVSEDIADLLSDMVSGIISMDNIEAARIGEASNNTEHITNELTAIMHTFGISAVDITKKILEALENNQDEVVFQYGNTSMYYSISLAKSNAPLKAYTADMNNYDIRNSKECNFFTYITQVAREVGSEQAERHVGIEFYLVAKGPKSNPVLYNIETMLNEKVSQTVLDVKQQRLLDNTRQAFICNRFFEIALKGTLTWPQMLGGEVITVPSDLRVAACSCLERRIELLTAFCEYTSVSLDARHLSFNAYCTNAIITPTRVIPRKGCTIHEASFNALWYNWAGTHPEVHAQLVGLGVLPSDHVAWELRCISEQFVQRGMIDADREDSLIYYANKSAQDLQNYPNDLEFVAVEHPISYMFPGIFRDNSDIESDEARLYANCAKLPTPRDGDPVVRLGIHKTLTSDLAAKVRMPSKHIQPFTTGIRRFTGFDVSTMLAVPDVMSRIPDETCLVTVHEPSQTIYVGETGETINYTRINELISKGYPVAHIYNRTYLLRATDGKIWEVVL